MVLLEKLWLTKLVIQMDEMVKTKFLTSDSILCFMYNACKVIDESYIPLADIDFNISQETQITFDNVTTSQCFQFSLMNDTFAEDDETVAFEVSSTTPSNVMRVGNITTEITIIDNEGILRISSSTHPMLIMFCSR